MVDGRRRDRHLPRTRHPVPCGDGPAIRVAGLRAHLPPTPENKPSDSDETADQVADHVLATFLPNLERAPVPPSFVPPHGYEWCALTPMEFTEMEGWPDGVSEAESSRDTEARIALQRTILATWLLMG